MMFPAGHETSANTLSWVLFELSTHPDVQRSLRDEIRATRAKVNARGDKQILISDLESMKYNVSVIKVNLHPAAAMG
jgi:cytochrome P450